MNWKEILCFESTSPRKDIYLGIPLSYGVKTDERGKAKSREIEMIRFSIFEIIGSNTPTAAIGYFQQKYSEPDVMLSK